MTALSERFGYILVAWVSTVDVHRGGHGGGRCDGGMSRHFHNKPIILSVVRNVV